MVAFEFADPPYTTFTTHFDVIASWTDDQPFSITTTAQFGDAEAGNGHYEIGSLIVEDEAGNTLVLDASTGDPDTFLTILTYDGVVTSEVMTWNDDNRLPCISVLQGEDGVPGCTER